MATPIVFVIESLGLGGSKQAAANLAQFLTENTDFYPVLFSLRRGQVYEGYLDAFHKVVVGDEEATERIPADWDPLEDLATQDAFNTFYHAYDHPLVIAVSSYSSIFVHNMMRGGYIAWTHNQPDFILQLLPLEQQISLVDAWHDAVSVVALTESYAEEIKKFNPNAVPLPNIITTLFNQNPVKALSAKKELWSNDEITLAFIGRGNAVYHKGIDLLGAVLTELVRRNNWQVHVNLMGATVEQLRPYINQTVEEQLVFDNVGTFGQEEVFDIVENSNFLIATSRVEGLPNSIVESLQLNTPTIAYENSGAAALLPSSKIIQLANVFAFVNTLEQNYLEYPMYCVAIEEAHQLGLKTASNLTHGLAWVNFLRSQNFLGLITN